MTAAMQPIVVPDGALVLDTDTKLTVADLEEVAMYVDPEGRRVFGIERYVSLGDPNFEADIDPVEAGNILTYVKALGLVQHCLAAPPGSRGWTASSALGAAQGAAAARHADLVGYVQAAMLAPDNEDIASGDAVGWANAWAIASTWTTLLYTGFSPGMTPQQLYDLPDYHCYWGAAGAWDVAVCGVAMRQQAPSIKIGRVTYDVNIAQADRLGRRIVLATKAT